MINNKGFAVSAILYTLLIAFLLFLGAALAQFDTSTGIIGKANDDLINGTKFSAKQVKSFESSCNKYGSSTGPYWFNSGNGKLLVKINSRYGTMYWPKDFGLEINSNGNITGTDKENNNISVKCLNSTGDYVNCTGANITDKNTVGRDNNDDTRYVTIRTSDSYTSLRNSGGCGVSYDIKIPESIYANFKQVVEDIENFENGMILEEPEFTDVSVECSTISKYMGLYKNCTDINKSDFGMFSTFLDFEKYLKNYSSNNTSALTFSYNEQSNIFTFSTKISIPNLGTSTINTEFFPVVYRVKYDDYYHLNFDTIHYPYSTTFKKEWASCAGDKEQTSMEFNGFYFLDLVPVKQGVSTATSSSFDIIKFFAKYGNSVNTINGIDYVTLGEYNDAEMPPEEDNNTNDNVTLKITDTKSNKEITLPLYDICE